MMSLSKPVKRGRTDDTACRVCGTAFHPTTLDCPHQHWRRVKGHTVTYVCDVGGCEKTSKYERDAANHSRIHTGARPFVCSWHGCTDSFNVKSTLTAHVKAIHTHDRPWECPHPYCSHSAVQRSRLKTHVFGVHAEDREWVCGEEGCGADYKTKGALAKHMKHFHRDERDHVCDWPGCDSAFHELGGLRAHVKGVHEGIKDWECPVVGCEFASSRKSALKYHLRFVELREKRFWCDWCEEEGRPVYATPSWSHLKQHVRAVHYKIRDWECPADDCDYAASAFGTLKRHIDRKHV